MNILVLCLFFLILPIQAFDIWASEESKDKWNQQSKRMRAQGFTKALNSKSSSRIIGGKNADKGRYPYYAYIEVQTEEETFFCSATLIWEDVLLSAAHCVVDIEQRGFTITGMEAYIGLHDQGSPEDSEIREISIGVPHPSYDMETEENDILIFKLKTSVLTVYPVLLNFNTTIPADGQRVDTMGFGVVSESRNTSLPDTLQVVSTNVISFQNCNDADSYDGAIKNDLMICAGVTGGGKVCYNPVCFFIESNHHSQHNFYVSSGCL
jgi:secreted trypsin-like serine protease